MLRPFAVVVAAALAVPASLAATLYVDAAAPCPGLGTEAEPFCTIQAAINASVEGDVVLVAPGTYEESINFGGRRIHVLAADGPAVTTIDSSALGARAVVMTGAEIRTSILEGFTVYGGSNGGMTIPQGASPTVRNCVFANNTAPFGAGIHIDAASPLVQSCVFTNNHATQTTNVGGGGVLNFRNSVSVFEDCVFEGNRGEANGGGMTCSSSFVTLRRCEFRENTTNVTGGGISTVLANLVIEDCLFEDNVANPDLGNGSGGAIRSFGGQVAVRRSTFRGNQSRIGNACGHEGGTVVTYEDCLFEANTGGLRGGALSVSGAPATVDRCVFRNNTSDGSGGGLAISGVSASVRNSLFVGNTCAGFGGGGVYVSGTAAEIVNCTIIGNHGARGGGVQAEGADAQPVVINSIIRGNTAVQGSPQADGRAGGTVTAWSCNIQGGWSGRPGDNNIDADPMFTDAAAGDYTLAPGSPCIDAGDNTRVPAGVALDLAAGARFFDDPATADTGIGDAPIVDIGAYEFFIKTPPCPADFDGDGQVNSADLAALLGGWGAPGAGDLDGDGIVGSGDLAQLLGAWGACG